LSFIKLKQVIHSFLQTFSGVGVPDGGQFSNAVFHDSEISTRALTNVTLY